MAALPKKAHWPPAYIYLQTIVVAIAAWWMTRAFYQDDSYITLIYARNLLEGNGLSWNPGERIEGYTNFLYLILVAGLGWLGMDLVLASRLVAAAGYVGLVMTVILFTRNMHQRYFAADEQAYAHSINRALCICLTASSLTMVAWVNGGLETALFSCFLTLSICFVLSWLSHGISLQHAALAGASFALATMTRPEGLPLMGVTGLFLAFLWLKKRNAHITFKKLFCFAAGYLALFIPFMLWRFAYFGDFMPNTYYAKLYNIDSALLYWMGKYYFLQFTYLPPMLFLFVACLMYYCGREQLVKQPLSYLFVIALFYCWHIIASGGDHMPYLRFFVPLVPVMALMIYYCCQAIMPTREKLFRDLCGALLIFSVLQLGIVRPRDAYLPGGLLGEVTAPYINEHWKKDSLVALTSAGAMPYFAPNFRYIDMVGLNDKHIARRTIPAELITQNIKAPAAGHLKGDGAYVLSRKPDYIILGPSLGYYEPTFLSDVEMVNNPDFKKHYERVEAKVTPPAHLLAAFTRFAESIRDERPEDLAGEDRILPDKNGQIPFVYYKRRK